MALTLPLVLRQNPPRDDHLVDLVRAVVDTREAGLAVKHRQQMVFGDASGAEDLDGFVDNAVQDLGAEEFNERDLFARVLLALRVDLSRCVQGHQARRMDIGACFGDPVLDVGLLR